jgi:O-antigen ligase
MLNSLLCLFISALVLYPKPLVTISSYPIYSVYLLIPVILVFMPLAIFKKSYWQLPVTKSLWILRIVYLFIFLISSFYMDLSFSRTASFIGIISITFFYELPFIFNIELKRFFSIFNKLFILFLSYSTVIILYYLIKIRSPIAIIAYVQEYLPIYPNYFAMFLVIHFCARVFLLKKRSLIIDLWVFAVILITLSRTALLGLIIFYLIYIIGNNRFSFQNKLAVVLIAVLLLIPLSYFVLMSKGASFGSTLEHTFLTRYFRWETAIEVFAEHPLIGYGLDRSVNIVSNYHYIGGNMPELGSTHNDYIDVLIKSGIIGLLVFLAFCMKVICEGIRKSRLLFLIMLLMLAFAVIQNPFKNVLLMFYLYFIIGAVLLNFHKQNILS